MYREQEPVFRDLRRSAALTIVVLTLPSVLMRTAQAETPVHCWVSSADMSQSLSPQPPRNWAAGPGAAATTIHVDSSRTFQSILGLGSSLEHSTCYNISRLSSEQQKKVMESLVDTEKGIGMSLMRICIGTPDFAASPWYSYDDMPPGEADPELKHFSIDKDRAYASVFVTGRGKAFLYMHLRSNHVGVLR
jgi:hypothetical protein